MSFIDAFSHRIRSVFRAGDAARERDAEFAFHESLAARDLTPAHGAGARDAARREFGNATYLKEEVRWMGAMRWIDALSQDLRYGLRTLVRTPLFSVVALLSIGLGISANTAVFGMIYKVMLARLPVPHSQELVMLSLQDVRFGSYFSWEQYQAISRAVGPNVTAFGTTSADSVEIDGTRLTIDAVDLVDGGFYSVLGIAPAAGRLLTMADNEQGAPVLVTSYGFATRHFGSAQAALGRTIRIGTTPFSIVGVTQREYEGLVLVQPAEVIVPQRSALLFQPAQGSRDVPFFILARTRSENSPEAAAILAAYRQCCEAGGLWSPSSGDPRGHRAVLANIGHGISAGKADVRGFLSGALFALMGGVVVLLLITCTNVGNLLLARAMTRTREFAIRLSLGASRARIIRQLLVESSLLASLGAIVGIVAAVWGTAILARNLPDGIAPISRLVVVRPETSILLFTVAVAGACVLLFGAFPAIQATRLDLTAQLHGTATSSLARKRLNRSVVALQVALALVLASASGLLVVTLRNLKSGLASLDPARLLVVELDIRGTPHANAHMEPLYDQLMPQFRRIPGVQSVVGTTVVPALFGGGAASVVDVPGFESAPDDEMLVGETQVMPGYFGAMQIGLRGRDFSVQDARGSEPVAIISQTMATQLYAGRDPIGERFRWRRSDGPPTPFYRIVGVAEDVKYFDLRAAPPRMAYFPWAQAADLDQLLGGRPLFAIRTIIPAAHVVSAVREIIDAELPGVRIRRDQSLSAAAALVLGREQALATLALVFGAIAIALAAIGLYGVVSFHVSTRRREIGVRIALGADRGRVVRLILRQSFVVILVGAVLGVPLSLIAGRALGALLYGIAPWHPLPVLGALVVLLAVGTLAAIVPSRSAARVDPLIAMRAD